MSEGQRKQECSNYPTYSVTFETCLAASHDSLESSYSPSACQLYSSLYDPTHQTPLGNVRSSHRADAESSVGLLLGHGGAMSDIMPAALSGSCRYACAVLKAQAPGLVEHMPKTGCPDSGGGCNACCIGGGDRWGFNPRPAGPLDFPPPAGGGVVVENPPSISAPGPRSYTR